MGGRRWLPLVLAAFLSVSGLLAGCGGGSGGSGGSGGPAGGTGEAGTPVGVLGFRAEQVTAVVVSWEPTLARVPPPRRTTDRKAFFPLMQALGTVTERANPPDLLGPPVHITLELKGGSTRRLELWPPYLADTEHDLLYFVTEQQLNALQRALEPLSPLPIPPPDRVSGMIAVGELVKALKEHGAGETRETGRAIVPLFDARSGHVIEVLGQPVQVYVMDSPAAAARAAAMDPKDLPVEWAAPAHFAAVGNLMLTVVIPEQETALKILAYLQMVRG